jgi:predicted nicotinamide N-methyase
VIDVACGSGLVAIAAGIAGAGHVTAVDVDPLAVCATGLNAGANRVRVRALRMDPVASPELLVGQLDVVLAGDVLYEPDLAAGMLAMLTRAAAAGADVLLGVPRRRLRSAALPAGSRQLGGYQVPTHPDLEGDPWIRTDLVALRSTCVDPRGSTCADPRGSTCADPRGQGRS